MVKRVLVIQDDLKSVGDYIRIQGVKGSRVPVTGKARAFFEICCWVNVRTQKAYQNFRERLERLRRCRNS